MRTLVRRLTAYDWIENRFMEQCIYWKEDGFFFRSVYHSPGIVDLDTLPKPDPIPMEDIRALWHEGLTVAPSPLPQPSYVKVPDITTWEVDAGEWTVGKRFSAEVEILETLRKHPHPNLCAYLGCSRDGDYIEAIYFQRYLRTLEEAVEMQEDLDRESIIAGITAGIEHLHSLGLVHCDIKPQNIMLDDKNVPVVIDFGSCEREGQIMVRGGATPGWAKSSWMYGPGAIRVAFKERDLYAIGLVEKYLRGEWSMEEINNEEPEYLESANVSLGLDSTENEVGHLSEAR
ncbi:hypothetical protein HETIRDRAFT_432193 [Heterobasidion irregulare TC 32-1]|uniref:Protein kinase domain-containing protein n=1 Tax=Heterobasidion irregulare (strain TC 32-1) TaxID=747525 RepID=W4KHW1_HETIT|nr:uncharacterized protein HETIRDRAFT_432193 [Heterobasidion irregulare TC 32-1]ETW85448.1 hypothetical protein HETIRDRAFT_432193 [Heterobasidion irregulare TC 32-1]